MTDTTGFNGSQIPGFTNSVFTGGAPAIPQASTPSQALPAGSNSLKSSPSFTFAPSVPTTNQPILFTNTSLIVIGKNTLAASSFANTDTKISCMWDFGDGLPSQKSNHAISYQYSKPGKYIVTLTVTYQGSSIECSSPITVNNVIDTSIAKVTPLKTFTGWDFRIGFDNIRFGLATYSDKSIYVSSPSTPIVQPGLIGLKVQEKRPSASSITGNPELIDLTYDAGDDTFFFGSIEYWVAKQNFDKKNIQLGTSIFPILPTGVTRVNHERLLLADTTNTSTPNDTGYTQFFTDTTLGNVLLFGDGNLLQKDTDWDDITTENDQTPNMGTRMRYGIHIINPIKYTNYTVTYTPLTSNTNTIPQVLTPYSMTGGINIVDLTGDMTARSLADQTVLLDNSQDAILIDHSVLYLIIMLRNNTGKTTLSPSIESYLLAISNADKTKYQG